MCAEPNQKPFCISVMFFVNFKSLLMYAIKVDRSSVFVHIGQTTENYFSVYFLGLLSFAH